MTDGMSGPVPINSADSFLAEHLVPGYDTTVLIDGSAEPGLVGKTGKLLGALAYPWGYSWGVRHEDGSITQHSAYNLSILEKN